MAKYNIDNIPVVSGQKYTNIHGVRAVKDGIKSRKDEPVAALPKPPWLRIKLQSSPKYQQLVSLVNTQQLSTVCEESKCPNMAECWSHGTATLMLMGSVCTRACKFCSVDTGNPRGWLDYAEPQKVAHTVTTMALEYVVLTSVDRDDLPDGGAAHYASCIKAIKAAKPEVKVEALTPDFNGIHSAIDILLDSDLDVFAQNLETVQRLTHPVRDPRAGYQQTLDVLLYVKQQRPEIYTKSSLMLGLGETKEEILQTMDDLRAHKVDILTLGQYLQPTKNHYPIARYVSPEEFAELRELGLSKGFYEVAAGPMVRSSYRADRVFKREI
jgi:lipoic acid synthetase